ncbi:uncharacterized protein LOC106869081 [Octopus bimaculoides]|uniref:SMB domain-containing protein n=1 Tax=Octopus bimaculoides TaxID=37653 RepID=A0A0L8IFA5_OCTBM|nr:uncharacterized protein LOC106869081 [Octopus bimaculoides]|eukprot:XP_014770093.1 PREDICTED: uncharacterized protein LOC106869081 [Octopus bimaculoides]
MVKITSICFCFLLGLGVLFDSWAEAGCARPCLLSFFRCVRSVEEECCSGYRTCMKDACDVANPSCNDNVGKRSGWYKRGSWDKRGSWNKKSDDQTKRGSWNKRSDEEDSKRGSWNKRQETDDFSEAMLKKVLNENYGVHL